ncbi:MAG: OmpH family outer membrane protein [Prevotella sp.]|jgi:outer membrane protein|uniref:OmpH family outer membrane protein n=1 Tax=unclassified Dysgonomonas TaxID=2630389 RepID=UPI0025BF3754|nr:MULTISPECIES: OmpH family outer membrane protein [unclassified Dysgonomonas]MDR1715441.1 OmpH family outer membrane protein [Prevotella sp.]MDR2002736.1 OmpH family outer membrane protein [Prevotella sp.]HMM03628.1 OmpH family outer membrane protein [Dysgonomonas sp.]
MKPLLFTLFLLLPLTFFAQNKLAYVNVDEVFSKMPELKDVETKLSTKNEAVKKSLTAMQTEYNQMLERYGKTPTDSITQAIAEDRQKQMMDFQERYRVFSNNSQQELEKEQQTLLAPLQQKLMKAIKDVGEENGYTYILNSSTLLHVGADAKDANGQVKAKLGITN